MGTLRYGTCSWSEKSWVGPFYPPGTKPGDFLTAYAEHFDCVEADVTYYRIPDARMVDGWRARTPEGFELCAKFPRSIVHGGDAERPSPERVLVPDAVWGEVEQFLGVMQRLGDRLGPLVLQFPYFNRHCFAGAAQFLDRMAAFLDRLPKDFRYAVEVRNKGWIAAPLLSLLRERGVAFVLTDIAYMPHPAEYAERLDVVTADFAYARLIGDRKAVEERSEAFDRIVLDQSERLERWARVVRKLLERLEGEVYTFANNHYAGHGPATIRELAWRAGVGPPPC